VLITCIDQAESGALSCMSAEWLSRQWVSGLRRVRNLEFTRSFVLLAVVLAHVVALYALTRTPSRIGIDGPPLIREAISKKWVPDPVRAIRSRQWQPPAAEVPTYDGQEWHFPRVDIWPVTGEACPTPSEFGPLMDVQPVAEEAQGPPQHAPAQSTSAPAARTPRMVLWLRPAYPLEWARTELEGTIRLGLRIRPTGDTYQIAVERSSGSQKLDAVATEAAKSWRFTPATRQGPPIESKATVELTFNFFEYKVSLIDDEVTTRDPKTGARRTVHLDRSEVVRRLVEQLRTRTTNVLVAPVYADGAPPWPAAMRDWGPISDVQYIGTVGRPESTRYNVKLKFRTAEHANSVVVRWELYRVVHENHSALWEVGLDRTGGVWAFKAQSADSLDPVNKSATSCPAEGPTKD
jgi:protein TonB